MWERQSAWWSAKGWSVWKSQESGRVVYMIRGLEVTQCNTPNAANGYTRGAVEQREAYSQHAMRLLGKSAQVKLPGEITRHIKRNSTSLDIGGCEMLKKVNKFYYLGDMISSNGSSGTAVTARMQCT